MDGLILREMFRDGAPQEQIQRASKHFVKAAADYIRAKHEAPPFFSLKALSEATAGKRIILGARSNEYDRQHKLPLDIELAEAAGYTSRDSFVDGVRSAPGGEITVSLFPVLAGNILINKIRDRIQGNLALAKSMRLVTPMQSSLPVDVIPGVNAVGAYGEVKEGDPYPSATQTEDNVQIGYKKFGEMLRITKETVRFDRTGYILKEADRIADRAGREKARYIMEMVTDKYSRVFRPGGAATALYTTGARAGGINQVNANALATEANLKTARIRLATNTERDTVAAEKGKKRYLDASLDLLLVPTELYDLAYKLTGYRFSYNPGSTNPNELNVYEGKELIDSAILSETSTSVWYAGNARSQFVLKVVEPLTVARQDMASSDEGFERDITFKVKTSEWYEVGAESYEYFIKNN